MWQAIEDRLALLELLARGRLPRRQAQLAAWQWLSELPWTKVSTRQGELLLDSTHQAAVEALLQRVWPEVEEVRGLLGSLGLPPTPKGWEALSDLQRSATAGALPSQVNQRTLAAVVAPHSKAKLTPARLLALGPSEVTRDGSVRMRPCAGLTLTRDGQTLDAALVGSVLGEVVASERAFLRGLTLSGPIAALLLVENLGAFCDLAPPPGWLVIHVAGWETSTVEYVLRQLSHVPAVHFGDLDPNGLRIYRHLKRIRANLSWAVPGFWEEWVPKRAQVGSWPAGIDLSGAPPLVRRLAQEGLWLEQETIVLDSRLGPSLVELIEERT